MNHLLGSSITYRIAVGPQKGNQVFTLRTLPDSGHDQFTTRVRYELKTPWRNGTTHVIFEPLDFMYRMYGMSRAHGCAGATISKLVALVPKPRVNLTRFHGVFAPNSKYRAKVTPARRGKRKKYHSADEADQTPAEKRASMTGFCSCKTCIHAILGNNLGKAIETCFQY